jgi:hypothetical protein
MTYIIATHDSNQEAVFYPVIFCKLSIHGQLNFQKASAKQKI